MVVSFSITDIVGIIDLSRKIWVAFDEGPRGAKDDFAVLYQEYGQFVKTFASLKSFFESQSECEYDFTALQATLERLKKILDKYGRLKGSVTAGRVIDTVKYPFKKHEIENVRLHLTRHQESLMLYFAQQNLHATHQTRDVARDINERTEEIYRIVQHLRAQLNSVLVESPRRSNTSPDFRLTPLVSAEDDPRQVNNGGFSSLPSAMMSSQVENPEPADIVELPDVSTLTHIDPAEIEAIRKLWRQDSGIDVTSVGSRSPGLTRPPTFDQFLTPYSLPPPAEISPNLGPVSRPSSDYSPGVSPRMANAELHNETEGALEYLGPPGGVTGDHGLGQEGSIDKERSEPTWNFFCADVVVKSWDNKHVFRCRSCPSKEQRMSLKYRKRSNGNLKLRLGCSKCDRLVLEHECRLTMPLIPYTFYTGYDDDDALAIFFNSCSGHPIPGKGLSTQPKYLFGSKTDYIKFQELIYGMNYVNSWNVKDFRTSDGNEWSDETIRLFRDDLQGLTTIFYFVLKSNGGKGYFEASKELFETQVDKKGKRCKLRLKKAEDVPRFSQILARRASTNTSSNSTFTDNSAGSNSSSTSVAASCLSFDGPPTHSRSRRRSSGSNKQIIWKWIEFTFLNDKDCENFTEVWSNG